MGATCKGLWPLRSVAFTSAPCASNNLTVALLLDVSKPEGNTLPKSSAGVIVGELRSDSACLESDINTGCGALVGAEAKYLSYDITA